LKKKTTKAGTVISNNTITMEPFVLDRETAIAVQEVAKACAANARALERVAEKLGGPTQYGIGVGHP
jgi:hypothetical protein